MPNSITSKIRFITFVINEEKPEILNEILAEKKQLAKCLEYLGCHGFVNVKPTGQLVSLLDAVIAESNSYYKQIKLGIKRLQSLQKELLKIGKLI